MVDPVAAEKLRVWREDPVVFVREVFGAEPDAWQADVLRAFPKSPRVAMQACKGPGKSCLLAWLVWNFLSTRPHPKIAVTSVTSDNLMDGLWTELAKWQKRSAWLQQAFTWTKTRVFANESPETWWASARTWPRSANPQQQADTLAGLHADYLLFILDEAGSIPDSVMAAAEAGLATGIECHIVIAGNPTMLSGPLYRAATRERHFWHVVAITGDPDDPMRSPRISIEWARLQIEKYGRDNPWVLVNVFGQFPPSSINSLLGVEDVLAAMRRHYREDEYQRAGRVLGVDVARQGDDATVIFPRQGLVAFPPEVLRNADSDLVAGKLARRKQDWDTDMVCIDATGGWGWGAIDSYRRMGNECFPVQFSGKASKYQFANKRIEMWWDMAKWVKEGGALPDVPELVAELTEPTYTFKGDQMLLEPKEQIKDRIGRSPDLADALALTFAHIVPDRKTDRQKLIEKHGLGQGKVLTEWDPLGGM